MPIAKHPDADMVYACPECDTAGQCYRRKEADPEYSCHECGATFDNPAERENRDQAPPPCPTGADNPNLPDFVKDAIENYQ